MASGSLFVYIFFGPFFLFPPIGSLALSVCVPIQGPATSRRAKTRKEGAQGSFLPGQRAMEGARREEEDGQAGKEPGGGGKTYNPPP